MIKDKSHNISILISAQNLEYISKDTLDFCADTLEDEGKWRFKIGNQAFSIFKEQYEPYLHTFLKSLGFYIYKHEYENLEIDPQIYRKYRPDLASFDYKLEPVFWGECLERDFEKIEYICKHFNIQKMALFEITEEINPYIRWLKKNIHYKYNKLISVVNFDPQIIYYVDPEDVLIIEDWYQVINLEES